MKYGIKSLAFAVVAALVFSISGAQAGNHHPHGHHQIGFPGNGFPGNGFPGGGFPGGVFPGHNVHKKKHIHVDPFFFPPHFHQHKKFIPPHVHGGFPGQNFHHQHGGGIHLHFGK